MSDQQGPNILIVDDDQGLRETLADFLSGEGYGVREAPSAPAARRAIEACAPDLVLLDISMPGGDGLTLAAELRARSSLPIIMISGKSATIDRVVGLEVGADDYLAKPFELRELLARVRAVLRRARAAPVETGSAPARAETRCALFGPGFLLDVEARQLRDAAGALVPLTAAEFSLLMAFVERPNRVLSRDQIADLTRRDNWDAFDRSIDTQVSRLRRKLEPRVADGAIIQTVRGEGYVFAGPVQWRGGI